MCVCVCVCVCISPHRKDALNVQCGISQVCQECKISVERLLIPEEQKNKGVNVLQRERVQMNG